MGMYEKMMKAFLEKGNCNPVFAEEILAVCRSMEKQLTQKITEPGAHRKALVVYDTDAVKMKLLELAEYEKQRRIRAEQECEYMDSVIQSMEKKLSQIRSLIDSQS